MARGKVSDLGPSCKCVWSCKLEVGPIHPLIRLVISIMNNCIAQEKKVFFLVSRHRVSHVPDNSSSLPARPQEGSGSIHPRPESTPSLSRPSFVRLLVSRLLFHFSISQLLVLGSCPSRAGRSVRPSYYGAQ